MLTLILIALFMVSLLILWLSSSPFYWKKKGVPYLLPLPLFGNSLPSLFMTLQQYYDKLYQSYPNEKFFGFHFFIKPVIFLRDPEIIKDVFIKDFQYFTANGYNSNYDQDSYGRSILFLHGEAWKEIRGKLSKYFTPYKLRSTVQEYVELSMKKLNKSIQQSIEINEPIEIDKLLIQLTTDVIVQSILGIESDSFSDNSYFNNTAKIFFSSWTNAKHLFGLIMPEYFLKLKLDIFGKDGTGFLRKVVLDVIDQREKDKVIIKDFVGDMMKLIEESGVTNDETKRYYPDNTIIPEYNFKTIFSQMLVLIAGGLESSAMTMSFFLYEIAINQEIQEKCRQEIIDVMNETGTDIRQEDVSRLTYLEMTINETLRKYPAFIIMPRRCTKQYTFRDSDVTIEPGTLVILPIRSIQWDPKYYPEPEKFVPERFSKENKANMDQEIFYSWGLGPRTCLGINFAKLEIVFVLSRLLSTYRFTMSSKTSDPIKFFKHTLIEAPDPAIWLNIERLN